MDIVALGELLIDFTQDGVSAQGMNEYERNPGGAPANLLVAAAHLGCETAMIAKVGDDMHGRYLKTVLEEHHVDISHVILDPEVFTTLAFVNIAPDGERSFSFARKPGADTCLRADEVDMGLVRAGKVFHFGTLSLTDEPVKGTTIAAVRSAVESGVTVSFDPNYRDSLWRSRTAAEAAVREVLPYVDIVKCSEEETGLLTGEEDSLSAAEKLVADGKKIVIVTLGKRGALVRNREGYRLVPAFSGNVVDTTGAGDSFMGGFLAGLVRSGKKPEELSLEELATFARLGNAVAMLCVQDRGGINSIPDRKAVEALLKRAQP